MSWFIFPLSNTSLGVILSDFSIHTRQGFPASALLTLGAGPFLVVGSACALWGVEWYLWSPPTPRHPPPRCDNQKCLQIWPSVHWRQIHPWLREPVSLMILLGMQLPILSALLSLSPCPPLSLSPHLSWSYFRPCHFQKLHHFPCSQAPYSPTHTSFLSS